MTASNSLLRFLGKRPLRSFDEEDLLELARENEAEVCKRRLLVLESDSDEPSGEQSPECSAKFYEEFVPLPQSGSCEPTSMQTSQQHQESQEP